MNSSNDFLFPFPPYAIQIDFMKCLYSCLDNGNLGIFESPTGTGKSLSIICGALKWLIDHEKKKEVFLQNQLSHINDKFKDLEEKSHGDWFLEQTQHIEINAERQIILDKLKALERRDARRDELKKYFWAENSLKKKRVWNSFASKLDNNDANTDSSGMSTTETHPNEHIDMLLEEIDSESMSDDEENTIDNAKYTQLFFCSRTHSQLTQFIGEIKQSPYAEKFSLVPLASRQSYCINTAVKKLRNVNMINDRCLQLQRKKCTSKAEKDVKRSKNSISCPFNPGNQRLMIAHIVTKIQDVSEIATNAEHTQTCAYYATRRSISDSQIVLLSYNSIFHKNTRISSGIDLKDNVLIIDEAHNLLEAIEMMHSATITGRNILHCYNQLAQYQKRFEAYLSPKNVMYIGQLSFCLRKFMKVLGGTTKSKTFDEINSEMSSEVYTVGSFEIMAEIDTINIFELLQFINNSKLIHKLRAYTERYGNLKIHPVMMEKSGISKFLTTLQEKNEALISSTDHGGNIDDEEASIPLMFITKFLESLKSDSADGRIFIRPGTTVGQGSIKFLLMNPAAHFHDIVKDSRAVILAGGTMEPISEFREQLFVSAGADPSRIVTFSCDHVVPKQNILTRILMQGPTGIQFEFNYHNRENKELLNELSRTLKNFCMVIPGGIVIFLPSYNYEEILYKHLESSGALAKIRERKQIFREPKLASQMNAVLENYANAIKHPRKPQNGSILFSVVGGKLSEGLNFSDELGRCVIVVGMPYPNIKSLEIREKMKYLDRNVKPGAGNEFYENACMKAVNQCIGRAVRHINDYSTVILLDKRYVNKVTSLPRWIQRTLAVNNTFNKTMGDVATFFATKRKEAQ